ncbi:hypothetical protein J6590_002084 [Homalodisca vitripennis]|nr:hypothetical protein J6590_002084 [Homalodisca vitripennis]
MKKGIAGLIEVLLYRMWSLARRPRCRVDEKIDWTASTIDAKQMSSKSPNNPLTSSKHRVCESKGGLPPQSQIRHAKLYRDLDQQDKCAN